MQNVFIFRIREIPVIGSFGDVTENLPESECLSRANPSLIANDNGHLK